MAALHPKTLPEWKSYAATLSGDELHDKGIAANSVAFVRTLQSEGYSADEIHSILVYLARRFAESGQHPPGDGLYDLAALSRSEPPIP